MDANILPVSTLNDIVFEGRNKAYGAYALRQNYNRELARAAGISFSSALCLFGFFYASVHLDPNQDAANFQLPKENFKSEFIEPILPKPLIPEQENPAPPINQPAAIAQPVATTEFKEIRIVTDETLVTSLIPGQNDLSVSDPGLSTLAGEIPGTSAAVLPEAAGTGTATSYDKNAPFVAVEQMPEFPEGLAAMYKFINKNLRYPAQAQAQGLEGDVVLTFVVSATGQISDIQVVKEIGGGAAEEAIRVIRKMPDWRPGRQNRQAVPVRFTLPIRFKLN